MPGMGLAVVVMLLVGAGLFFLVFVIIPLIVLICAENENTVRVARRIFIGSLTLVAGAILIIGYKEYASGVRRKAYIRKLRAYVPAELRERVPAEFYSYTGDYDSWRFPLVWPYEIACYESEPVLQRYRGDELLHGITHLAFDPNLLVAGNSSGWIVFEFASGKYEQYSSEGEAFSEGRRRGFTGDTHPEDLDTHYRRFIGVLK